METTGIGLVCYSNNMENENIEGLERDINVLKRQRRRQTELNTECCQNGERPGQTDMERKERKHKGMQ